MTSVVNLYCRRWTNKFRRSVFACVHCPASMSATTGFSTSDCLGSRVDFDLAKAQRQLDNMFISKLVVRQFTSAKVKDQTLVRMNGLNLTDTWIKAFLPYRKVLKWKDTNFILSIKKWGDEERYLSDIHPGCCEMNPNQGNMSMVHLRARPWFTQSMNIDTTSPDAFDALVWACSQVQFKLCSPAAPSKPMMVIPMGITIDQNSGTMSSVPC
ncbi:hypothetical protein C8J56DRAFT_902039 [Mycena floridula]|nr:hypothetical protein C8J56DRAFT_902039 [Mycena floridula]